MENSPRCPCLLSLSISLSIFGGFCFYPTLKKLRKLRKLNKLKSEKTGFKKLAGLRWSIAISLPSLFSLFSLSSLFSFPTLPPVPFFLKKDKKTGLKIEKQENCNNYTSPPARLKK